MLNLIKKWWSKSKAKSTADVLEKEAVHNFSLQNIDIRSNIKKLVKFYYLTLGEDSVGDFSTYIPPSVISVTNRIFLSINERGAVMALQDTEEEYSDLPVGLLITYPDTILKNTYFMLHINQDTLHKYNISTNDINRALVFIDSSNLLSFGLNLLYHPNDRVTTIDISSDNFFAVFLLDEGGMVNIDFLVLDEESGKRNILEVKTLLMYMGNLFFIPSAAHETLIHYKLMLPLLKSPNIL
jgi:hypothetical protein